MTIGARFELVFNDYFNKQEKYKYKVDFLKDINPDWNNQTLGNLSNYSSISPIMIEICKITKINLNFLIGTEENMYIDEKEKYMVETELKDSLFYKSNTIKNTPILSIAKINDVLKFQTNSINIFFTDTKKYIVIMKGGLSGIVSISNHYEKDKLFITFDINKEDFFSICKEDIEIIAEEIIA